VSSGTHTDDIDDMGTFVSGTNINTSNNYAYDAEGRLIKDVQEQIASIEWRVDGKVKKINRTSGSSKKNVSFDYDAMGHRIAKHQYSSANVLEKSTYYVLDAQGNIMSSYVREIISSTVYYSQKEKFIFGNTNLGVLNDSIPLYGSQNNNYSQTTWTHSIGKRNYSLTEHRRNVLTVISDKPILHGTGGVTTPGTVVDYFMADILQTSDYTPFGVTVPERNLKKSVSGIRDYSMGFQGQLEDDEIKGEGNSLNFEFRMHDPRLGRFFAVDPLTCKYPWNSPYAFSENRVLDCFELEGLEAENVHYYNMKKQEDGSHKAVHSYSSADLVLKSANSTFKNTLTQKETPITTGYKGKQGVRTNVYTYWNRDGTINRQIVCSRAISIPEPVNPNATAVRPITELEKVMGEQLHHKLEVQKEMDKMPGFYEFSVIGDGIVKGVPIAGAMLGQEYMLAGLGFDGLIFSSTASQTVTAVQEMTTVGRWMSQAEYDMMASTGQMVEGAGGQTFVTTGGAESFTAAAKGSVYAEFQVPTNSLLQGGEANWFKVIGPSASPSQQFMLQKAGGEALPMIENLTPILQYK
jgi:RHS repeat-associated protein